MMLIDYTAVYEPVVDLLAGVTGGEAKAKCPRVGGAVWTVTRGVAACVGGGVVRLNWPGDSPPNTGSSSMSISAAVVAVLASSSSNVLGGRVAMLFISINLKC